MVNKSFLILLLVERLLAETEVESEKKDENGAKETGDMKEEKPCKITDVQNFHSCLKNGTKFMGVIICQAVRLSSVQNLTIIYWVT